MDKFVLATLRGLTNIDVLKLEFKKKDGKRIQKQTRRRAAYLHSGQKKLFSRRK